MKITTVTRTLLFTFISTVCNTGSLHSQSNNVITAYNYLLDQNYLSAQKFIDAAIIHQQTSQEAKTWYYRGLIYEGIYYSEDSIKYAEFKNVAFLVANSYKKALSFDTKNINEADLKKRYVRIADFIFQDGIKYFNEKDFLTAVKHFKYCEEIKFSTGTIDSLAIFNQALSFENAGDFEKAIENYRRSIDINYYVANSYSSMAFIYGQLKDDKKAMKILEEARIAYPNNLNLLTTEINYLLKYQMFDQAINNLNLVIDGGNDTPAMYYTRGTIFNNKGLLTEAEADYKKALSLNSEYFALLRTQ